MIMDSLSNEIFLKIVLLLPIRDVKSMLSVCQSWHAFFDKYVSDLLYLREFPYEEPKYLDEHRIARNNLYHIGRLKKSRLISTTINSVCYSFYPYYRWYNDNNEYLLLAGAKKHKIIAHDLKFYGQSEDTPIHHEINTIFDEIRDIRMHDNLVVAFGHSGVDENIYKNDVEILKLERDGNKIFALANNHITTPHIDGIDCMRIVNDYIVTTSHGEPIINRLDMNAMTNTMLRTDLYDTTTMHCSEKFIMLGTENGSIHVYDNSNTACFKYNFEHSNFSNQIHHIDYDPNSNMLVYATQQYFVGYDLRSSKPLFQETISRTRCNYSRFHYGDVPIEIDNMKVFNGMIIWNSFYPDETKHHYNGHLNVWNYNKSKSKLFKNSDSNLDMTGILNFCTSNNKLVTIPYSEYETYEFYDLS